MSTLETERPDGRIYKRRTPLKAESLCWNEDGMCVMVYGTHDAALAHDLALTEWRCEDHEGDLPEPEVEWVKAVPWDAFGYGWDRTVLSVSGNMKGSTPALRYGGEWA